LDEFAQDFNIINGGKFKLSAMHVSFASAFVKPMKGQTKMGLNRAEFIEILLRIAKAKYFDTKTVGTVLEALQKLVNEDLLADWSLKPAW